MEITNTNEQCTLSDATVVELTQESNTIKRIVLQVEDSTLSFKAGQWVDFFIPGVSIFTGYSMCSSPHQLRDSGRLELAVKYTDYPPTLWVHTKCKVGNKVQIRIGGSFFYEITPHAPKNDFLLVAAGIGINPIYSIYQYFVYMHGQRQEEGGKLCMLYSAQTPEELVFKDKILDMAKTCPSVNVKLFSTRQKVDSSAKYNISNGRISPAVIETCLAKLEKSNLQAYFCGPPTFIDDMEQHCLTNSLDAQQIHYEKWW